MGCGHNHNKIVRGALGLAKAAARVDRADEAAIAARRDACRACPHASRNPDRMDRPTKGLTTFSKCARCSCFIAAKTVIAGESCPEGQW